MKSTIQITITVGDEHTKELLIARLSENGADAFEEKEDGLACFIDSTNYKPSVFENIISAYNLAYTETVIEEQNWNALWESSFEPVVVDNFCAIRAEFHKPFTDVQNEIIITPKMSFGTGHHATTYLMISEMSKLDFKDKTVADFGTGTGVLAILADKLGSKYIWAIDIDDWSIENATENIERNNAKNIIIEKKDSFCPTTEFDIILANINKNVILANVNAITKGVKSGGEILLSGLLEDDESDIVSAFSAHGCKHQSTVKRNKWICILLQTNGNYK